MTPKTGRGLGLLVALALLLAACRSEVTIPASYDPNAPASVAIVFRFPESGSLSLYPYASYTFQWTGEWVTDSIEVTNTTLLTHATQSVTVQKQDVYVSHVASLPPVPGLRGGYWSIALSLVAGPANEPIGLWNCVLPSGHLSYVPAGKSTVITFQAYYDPQNGDLLASCAATSS